MSVAARHTIWLGCAMAGLMLVRSGEHAVAAWCAMYVLAITGAVWLVRGARVAPTVLGSVRMDLAGAAVLGSIGIAGWMRLIWGPPGRTQLENTVLAVFPLCSIPALLLLIRSARALRSRRERDRERESRCDACGYDLTGNTSGMCPECGEHLQQGAGVCRMQVVRGLAVEPMWPIVGIRSCDFRPHFEGDLVNLFSCILPRNSIEETQVAMVEHVREMADWLLRHRIEFASGDRFQLILGWPQWVRSSRRQIVKIRGDWAALAQIADGTMGIEPFSGWTIGVFTDARLKS